MTMATKRKRISNVLPNDIISSLETSDRKAAKLRKSLISTETLPKSFAAKSQVDIQTKLFECRILMQRALSSLSDISDRQEEHGHGDKSMSIEKCLDRLLSQLIDARGALHASTLDTNDGSPSIKEQDRIENEYSQLRTEWKATLNRHHANIYLQNQQNKNKFQVVDQSFWAQIESNVEHSAMLDQVHAKKDEGNKGLMGFDDTKLYQHMLQEYILLSAQGGKDGAATAAIERLNRSMKKNTRTDVDRRASKGRKIRYVVHEKLQNFTFPMSRPSGGVMDDDVLFKSMFGGVAGKRKS
jgi:hypothetical protein